MHTLVFLLLATGLVAGTTDPSPPAEYNVLSELTPVRDAGDCGISAAFALNTALELAHYRATGSVIQFSEQEYIDCTYWGCRGAGMESYVVWLEVLDRLSAADKYTGYSGEQHTCRAGTSPNSLTAFRVNGYSAIGPSQVAQYIFERGSVIACIDTDSCPEYAGYRGGVITVDSREDDGELTCRQVVSIVGYTADTYIVRNSVGQKWGEEGYFRIARGNNTCGIEEYLYVVNTEERNTHWDEADAFSLDTCPPEYPIYCEVTRSCVEPGQACFTPTHFGGSSTTSKHSTDRSHCEDDPTFPCNPSMAKFCEHQAVRERCGATCSVPCDEGPAVPQDPCKDKDPTRCPSLTNLCDSLPSIRKMCPETCGVSEEECSQVERGVVEGYPPYGPCHLPHIPNGSVLNSSPINSGERLEVQCDEGYELVGEEAYCEFQNVFRPDTRRLPECVRLGGEDFTGHGLDYIGRKSTTMRGEECGNWKEMLYTGQFFAVDQGNAMKGHGNHNYCRSGEGDWVPYCMLPNMLAKSYCFATPQCGSERVCNGVQVDKLECGDVSVCEAPDATYLARISYYYYYCGATCCEHAGCQ